MQPALKPSLPSIRSIPLLAQYLSPSASAISPTLSSRSINAASPNVEVLDLTASDESGFEESIRDSPPAAPYFPWKASKRIGRKLTPRACGPCKKLHTECAVARPCPGCVKRGRAHLCVDVPGKRDRRRGAKVAALQPRQPRPSLTRTPPSTSRGLPTFFGSSKPASPSRTIFNRTSGPVGGFVPYPSVTATRRHGQPNHDHREERLRSARPCLLPDHRSDSCSANSRGMYPDLSSRCAPSSMISSRS